MLDCFSGSNELLVLAELRHRGLVVLLDVLHQAQLTQHFDVFLLDVGHFHCYQIGNAALEDTLLLRLGDSLGLEKEQIVVGLIVDDGDLEGRLLG